MFGTLYVVSTPIGNLEDVTLRALRVLKQADLIAAEDTRHTARLLHRYEIGTATTSFHEHNERQKLPALVARLKGGASIALVSDAGTPGIRDPGYRLVRAAIDEQIPVEVVPGPSAVLTALVASGLPMDTFTFLGFPPAKAKARAEWLARMAGEPRTVVFFEAPHRIRETLEELARVAGDREVALARELTKVHEEVLRGTAASLLARLPEPRGEITVLVAPPSPQVPPATVPTDEAISRAFAELTTTSGTGRRGAISALARRYGIPSKEVYAAIERQKARAPQQ
jgi:16S rRNA (cytidine1402-2'-O)-methyltransferase